MPKMTPVAIGVEFNENEMIVRLGDARTLSVPLEWFPRLKAATPELRAQWRLIGAGVGISWEALDEDISVSALLAA